MSKKLSTEALMGSLLAAVAILIAVVALFGLDTFVSRAIQGEMPSGASQYVISGNTHLVSQNEGAYLWFGEWTPRVNEAKHAKVMIEFPVFGYTYSQAPRVSVSINGYSFAGEHGMLQVSVVPGSVTSEGFELLIEQRKSDSELHWLDVQWIASGDLAR